LRTKPCLTLEDGRTITDDGGHTLLLTRMDGCAPVAKDRIAAGRVALLGVPIIVQGECVGAVGVSGIAALR